MHSLCSFFNVNVDDISVISVTAHTGHDVHVQGSEDMTTCIILQIKYMKIHMDLINTLLDFVNTVTVLEDRSRV